MFIAALFTIAKTRKQTACPSTDDWLKKMWDIYRYIYIDIYIDIYIYIYIYTYIHTLWNISHKREWNSAICSNVDGPRAAAPNLFGTGDQFCGRQFFSWWGDGSDGNVSDGEQWGAADEASLSRLPLTSCCVARFLTGHRPVLVCSPGVGDPWPIEYYA